MNHLLVAQLTSLQYDQHFVQFFGWFEDVQYLYFAMEYLELGDLQEVIVSRLPTEPEAASIVAQVTRALQYMHGKNFVHRDIKPKACSLDVLYIGSTN